MERSFVIFYEHDNLRVEPGGRGVALTESMIIVIVGKEIKAEDIRGVL